MSRNSRIDTWNWHERASATAFARADQQYSQTLPRKAPQAYCVTEWLTDWTLGSATSQRGCTRARGGGGSATPVIGARQGQGRVGGRENQSLSERLRAVDEDIEGRSAFRREPLSGMVRVFFVRFYIFYSLSWFSIANAKAPTRWDNFCAKCDNANFQSLGIYSVFLFCSKWILFLIRERNSSKDFSGMIDCRAVFWRASRFTEDRWIFFERYCLGSMIF